MICALKALVGWAILMFVGTNLVGFFVRGLVQQRHVKETAKRVQEFAARELQGSLRVNSVLNVLSGVVCIVYPYLLFRWWGWSVAIAGLILMLVRLPDLFFELRTGQKHKAANMPKRPIDIFATILRWLTLPLVWWGICHG
jgi:hypothetical protein